MEIKKTEEDKYTVVQLLDEKLDSRLAPALKKEFISLNTNGVQNMILNLGNVKYVDSSGLSATLTANRLCAAAGGMLVVCCLNPHVKKLLEISQLSTVLNIMPTQQEAIEAVFMAEIEKEAEQQGGTSEA